MTESPNRLRPTIREVAAEVGVGVATASRALNGKDGVSDATRARVQDAAKRIGYRVNLNARQLRSNRGKTIGVLIPSLTNPIYEQYLRGAAKESTAHGYSLFICDAAYDSELYEIHLDRLYEHHVSALIIAEQIVAHEMVHRFRNAGIPVDPRFAQDKIEDISHRNELREEDSALTEAYTHLIGLGHRSFLYVRLTRPGLPIARPGSNRRLEILRMLSADCGAIAESLELDPHEDIVDAIKRHVTGVFPSALIVTAPVLQQALIAVRQIDLRIPEDISLLSIGNTGWATAYNPPISTVATDHFEDGARAIRRVLGALGGDPALTAKGAREPAAYARLGSIGKPNRHRAGGGGLH